MMIREMRVPNFFFACCSFLGIMGVVRLPTFVGYALVGCGIGILSGSQLFKLHGVTVDREVLFGYGCHEEEPKVRDARGINCLIRMSLSMCHYFAASGRPCRPSLSAIHFIMCRLGKAAISDPFERATMA